MTEDTPVSIQKEMALTHADFFRGLPNAFPDTPYRVSGAGVTVDEDDGRTLEIALGPEGVRQIALLKLPMTRVALTFSGYAKADCEAVMEQFDRAFQRAGG